MNVVPPASIELTPEEQAFADSIDFAPDQLRLGAMYDVVLRESCAAARALASALLNRGAVPEIRLAYFTEARYNIGMKRSRREVFEDNGTRGEAILEHGHFLPILRYWIHGPNLPNETMTGFCALADDGTLTSGMQLDRLREYARQQTRQRGLDPKAASEEFYTLALECGLDDHVARSVRDAVRQTN